VPSADVFAASLEALADAGEARLSVILLEAVARNLTNKDASQEKKASRCRFY
jgi:hypothetical protein